MIRNITGKIIDVSPDTVDDLRLRNGRNFAIPI